MLGTLMDEGRRVERVVTDFLALSKPIELTRERTPLSTLIANTALPYIMRAETEQKTLLLPETDIEVSVDKERFHQMLGNLIQNGLDAVASGGTVFVTAAQKSDGVEICVDDDGKGITNDELQKVIKPFVSFKANGTGLGLPHVKRIAEVMGGTLNLEHSPKGGLKARLFFPWSSVNEN